MKRENIAKALMAASMFIFGTLAPFVRNINVSSGELALYRALMASALVGLFLIITNQKLSFGSMKKAGIRPMIHGFLISALVVIVALLVEMAMGIV